MCFRLLAAVRHEGPLEALEALAAQHGLDVRAAPAGAGEGYLEVCWGDCACSLYTRKDGRERAVAFVEALWARGLPLQLWLFTDGETLQPGGNPEVVSLEDFRARGLQALPEGRVAVLRLPT